MSMLLPAPEAVIASSFGVGLPLNAIMPYRDQKAMFSKRVAPIRLLIVAREDAESEFDASSATTITTTVPSGTALRAAISSACASPFA
jgi:hypothetical protein